MEEALRLRIGMDGWASNSLAGWIAGVQRQRRAGKASSVTRWHAHPDGGGGAALLRAVESL